jgi:hypothetical protein
MKNFWGIFDWPLRICGILFLVGGFVFLNPGIFKPLLAEIISSPATPMGSSNRQRIIYSPFTKSQLSLLVNEVQKRQSHIGDSLNRVGSGLKKDGLLKSGIVWIGVSCYSDSLLAIFDFYRNCGCRPEIAELIRMIPADQNSDRLVPVIQKKIPWNTYWFYDIDPPLDENYKESSSL